MIRFHIKTLGCKANQYESNKIANSLLAHGLTLSKEEYDLNIIIINTCSVTHIAERKSRQMIRKLIKNNPEAQIFVTGCATVSDKKRLNEILKENYIIEDKVILEKILIEKYGSQHMISDLKNNQNNTRSYLMIETGCDNFCSYCIIPYTRGPVVSRKFKDLCKEIDELVIQESKEIVITGINIGKYSYKNKNITDICKYIIENSTETRVRISSIEPNLIPDDLIDFMKREPRMCQHLHIPLQGGSNSLLKEMNRKYDTSFYLKLLKKIRSQIPDISITTDLIIGFPTESEKDFNNTKQFIQECNFSKIHIFPFSKRSGTKASEYKISVSPETIKKRVHHIKQIEKEMTANYIAQNLKKTLSVLIEEEKNSFFTGFTGNYLRVFCKNKKIKTNNFYNVYLDSSTPNGILAILT